MARLKERYEREIVPALREEFGYRNVMEVPRLSKVVVNMGVGDSLQDDTLLTAATQDLTLITGQKPKITRAKKSVSAFRVRAGMAVGCVVTLRGQRMWEFMDRLIAIALPRIRDFRGLSPRGLDGRGNYTLGLREQLIFPEINPDRVQKVRGMDVTIVTTAPTDREAEALLRRLGLPLRQR
jgi:large subunit ribosomal protein L5